MILLCYYCTEEFRPTDGHQKYCPLHRERKFKASVSKAGTPSGTFERLVKLIKAMKHYQGVMRLNLHTQRHYQSYYSLGLRLGALNYAYEHFGVARKRKELSEKVRIIKAVT